MILVGTSGYSYKDWVGAVYPAGTRSQDYLAHYKDLFGACELNFTYYRLPSARTMEGIVRKSEGKVTFTVKASQELTHERKDVAAAARLFREGVRPLGEAGRLGCVLLQFPYSFHHGPESLRFIETISKLLTGMEQVVEFRSADWDRPEVFSWLKEKGIGFCCVDEPPLEGLLRPMETVTSSIGYVRFHGRNAAKWWHHEEAAERYDYLYSVAELGEWVPRIRRMEGQARTVFVFTNNHYQGKAATNANQLSLLLKSAG